MRIGMRVIPKRDIVCRYGTTLHALSNPVTIEDMRVHPLRGLQVRVLDHVHTGETLAPWLPAEWFRRSKNG